MRRWYTRGQSRSLPKTPIDAILDVHNCIGVSSGRRGPQPTDPARQPSPLKVPLRNDAALTGKGVRRTLRTSEGFFIALHPHRYAERERPMTGRIRNSEDFREYLLEHFRANLRAKGISEEELEANMPTEIMMPDEEESLITVQMIPTKPRPKKEVTE